MLEQEYQELESKLKQRELAHHTPEDHVYLAKLLGEQEECNRRKVSHSRPRPCLNSNDTAPKH
jgi:hypothetical protein